MYLTRFRVNTARSEARRLLGSPHLMHGAVNAAFRDGLPERGAEGPRVLWRLDADRTGRVLLFVVSPARPDLTHLVERAGWPATEGPGWDSFAYDGFLDALTAGGTWAFRLTANPVHYIRLPGDAPASRTKRTAHLTPRHQMRWLLERGERAGFEIVRTPEDQRLTEHGTEHELVVRDKTPLRFHRPSTTSKGDVRLTRVTFEGRLRVKDPVVLRRTLTQGLGKARAYGCGLMTLAPVGGGQ